MNTKIDEFSEMEKVLNVKDRTNVELMSLIDFQPAQKYNYNNALI